MNEEARARAKLRMQLVEARVRYATSENYSRRLEQRVVELRRERDTLWRILNGNNLLRRVARRRGMSQDELLEKLDAFSDTL